MSLPTCVVHLTTVAGSVQASARVAAFLAGELKLPLVDSLESLRAFVAGHPPKDERHASYDVIMVNGPIAFCGIRDQLGTELLKHTRRLVWVQQDYTITPPPHHSTSKPTKAETPFRYWYHSIPEVALWTTCQDWLSKRDPHLECKFGDTYINWNALTYAPFKPGVGDKPIQKRLCYYGALREDRVGSLGRLLNGVDVDISVSRPTNVLVDRWRAVVPTGNVGPAYTGPGAWRCAPWKPTNGNKYGVQPLITHIADYAASIYVADRASDKAYHSLANRFYEVLSTPYTLLLLDEYGTETYKRAGLDDWAGYVVSDAEDVNHFLSLKPAKLLAMAAEQRAAWFDKDPYKHLRTRLLAVYKTWSTK
jgi:hypothetical protein